MRLAAVPAFLLLVIFVFVQEPGDLTSKLSCLEQYPSAFLRNSPGVNMTEPFYARRTIGNRSACTHIGMAKTNSEAMYDIV